MDQKDPVITQFGKPTKETYRFATGVLQGVSDELDVELRVGSTDDVEMFGRSSSNMYVGLIRSLNRTNELTAT